MFSSVLSSLRSTPATSQPEAEEAEALSRLQEISAKRDEARADLRRLEALSRQQQEEKAQDTAARLERQATTVLGGGTPAETIPTATLEQARERVRVFDRAATLAREELVRARDRARIKRAE